MGDLPQSQCVCVLPLRSSHIRATPCSPLPVSLFTCCLSRWQEVEETYRPHGQIRAIRPTHMKHMAAGLTACRLLSLLHRRLPLILPAALPRFNFSHLTCMCYVSVNKHMHEQIFTHRKPFLCCMGCYTSVPYFHAFSSAISCLNLPYTPHPALLMCYSDE